MASPDSRAAAAPAGDALRADPRRLLRRFVIFSIVSIAAILLQVGTGFHYIFREQLIAAARTNSVAVAGAIVAQELALLMDDEAGGGSHVVISQEEMPGFDLRMRNFLTAFGMVKVKVYDRSRRIVYSTDKTIIGIVDSDNDRLGRVLSRGEEDSELVTKEKVADLEGRERFRVDVVETYVPIRGKNGIVGAFEVYVDVSPAYARLVKAVQLSVTMLLTVLVAVFGALYIPMRQGTNRLAQVQDRLRELASVDMLTGLVNRRQLFLRIAEEYARMERAPEPSGQSDTRERVSFIIADIDYFKRVNDQHGHQAGDEVLRLVATRLKNVLRPYDVIGRYGGEEYLAMLPRTGLEDARTVAERMRTAVSGAPFAIEGREIAVTVSLGVADSRISRDEAAAVIHRADEGLYRAKSAGRDRVVAIA